MMKLRTALLTLLVTPILITPAKALLVETEQQFLEGVVVYITKKQEFADELKAHFSKATDPNYEYDSKKTPRIICELSDAEKLKEAGQFVATDIQEQLKRKHKIAAQDILTQSKNLALLDHATLSASEVVDRMVAAHGDMSGVQSIDSKARAIAAIYRGQLVDFYTNIKGGMGVFTDADLVQKIVRERFGQDTGDATAKKISDSMGDVFEGMRQRFNRSGGDIGKLDDWGLPQTHSLEKIVKAGKQAWVEQAERLVDTSKYVHEDGSYYSQQEIRSLLEYSFDTLASNGANKTEIGRQAVLRHGQIYMQMTVS